jgi:enhancing lycopene biosynthesis protein 2
MAKRVGVILSGCGHRDGTDAAETLLVLLMLDRAGADVICAAPDADQRAVVDHLTGAVAAAGAARRNMRAEAARLVRSPDVRPLAALQAEAVDALIIPGGEGVATALSDYADKGQLCQVHPDVTRLLRALLSARRPMGFFGLGAILAARVLGPVAGVRLTLGSKGTAAKHAAVMGADVRPGTVEDVIADQKARVFSTPGFLVEGARLAAVARAVDKLVRAVLANAKDRSPRPASPEPVEVETTGPTRGSA